MKKNLIIIIPARKGSSEIKNKNIKKVNGKHLIYYTCMLANNIKNKNFEIIGNTDCKNIAKIFNLYKINTPFLRPKKISNKYSLDISYINYTLNFFSKKSVWFKYGLILRPTSPLRSVKEFKKIFNKFKNNKKASSLRTVCLSDRTPFKMWKIKNDKLFPILKQTKKEMYNMPRQLLDKIYFQDGAYEFFKIDYKEKINSISGNYITYYKRNIKNLIDIDSKSDLVSFAKKLKTN